MAISMLKIRRPLGRLIFNMGIAIPGKTVFLIETAPWFPHTHVIVYAGSRGPVFHKKGDEVPVSFDGCKLVEMKLHFVFP